MAWPSRRTVHAPQWLVSQPMWVPVSRSSSRMKSTSNTRGSTARVNVGVHRDRDWYECRSRFECACASDLPSFSSWPSGSPPRPRRRRFERASSEYLNHRPFVLLAPAEIGRGMPLFGCELRRVRECRGPGISARGAPSPPPWRGSALPDRRQTDPDSRHIPFRIQADLDRDPDRRQSLRSSASASSRLRRLPISISARGSR